MTRPRSGTPEYDAETLSFVERRLKGESFAAIARTAGITRQRIQQRIKEYLGEEAVTAMNVVITERRLAKQGAQDERIREDRLRTPMRRTKLNLEYTDEEMLEALRRFERRYGPPVSGSRLISLPIEEREGCPTPPVYYRRFGTWTRACQLAGVTTSDRPVGRVYTRTWSDERIEEILLEFAREMVEKGVKPNTKSYVDWHKDHKDEAPSLATVRNVFIRWNIVMERVLERL